MSSFIQNMSLFVPRVFPNFTQEYIANAFSCIGDVNRVDLVAKQGLDGKFFNAVYIHFNSWNKTPASNYYLEDIRTRGSTKIYHDTIWYWIVLPNTAKKHIQGQRKQKLAIEEPLGATMDDEFYEFMDVISAEWDKEEAEALQMTDAEVEALQMADMEVEMEAIMAEDMKNLVTIDERYLRAIEHENKDLRFEVDYLRVFINLNQKQQEEK
jgi:hypothetical protein